LILMLIDSGPAIVFCFVSMINVIFLTLHTYFYPLSTRLENHAETVVGISLTVLSLLLSPFRLPFTSGQSVLLGSQIVKISADRRWTEDESKMIEDDRR
jgi:hypothetical protein